MRVVFPLALALGAGAAYGRLVGRPYDVASVALFGATVGVAVLAGLAIRFRA
jgi:site-specific recombinase